MLFEHNLYCVLEGKEGIAPRPRVAVGSQLFEVKLEGSLGETVCQLCYFLEVALLPVTGGALLLLVLALLLLLLLLALLLALLFLL
jgi:hypothetical protein